MQRVTEVLLAAQHPEVRRQPDKVRVDGFVVEPGDDCGVDIGWESGEAADPMVTPARGLFLAR